VRCLDIVRVIVSPLPSYSFGVFVVRNDVVVVGKLFVTDRTFLVLLDNLLIRMMSSRERFSSRPVRV